MNWASSCAGRDGEGEHARCANVAHHGRKFNMHRALWSGYAPAQDRRLDGARGMIRSVSSQA
jgi:hypothetical protein